MDSSHVCILGEENAASSKHASVEPPQPTAVGDTPPVTPSVLLPLSCRDTYTLTSASPQGGRQVPPGWHPMGFFCPALLGAQLCTMGQYTEHLTLEGQVLHHVGLTCPMGCAAESSGYHRGPFTELRLPCGALRTFPGSGNLPGSTKEVEKGGGTEIKHAAHDPDTLWWQPQRPW